MIFIWYVVSILLLVAILDMPSEYYEFLRVSVFSVSAFVAYKTYEAKDNAMAVAFIIVAVLFNPIYPIYLDNETLWKFIDFATAVLFIFNARKIDTGSSAIKLFTKLTDLIKRYKQQLTTGLTVIAIGIGITFYYNYQQEQERKAYYAIDKTDYFYCEGSYFGLNSSKSYRETGRDYKDSIWINYRSSENGFSEPYIQDKVYIEYSPDYIKIYNDLRYSSYDRANDRERPNYMIDRINGDLLDLKPGKTIICGGYDCEIDDDKEDIERLYERKSCKSKSEKQFYDDFQRGLDRYNSQRKF